MENFIFCAVLVVNDLSSETKRSQFCLNVCAAGGSDREELKKLPPPSPAVLWIVNICERKPR